MDSCAVIIFPVSKFCLNVSKQYAHLTIIAKNLIDVKLYKFWNIWKYYWNTLFFKIFNIPVYSYLEKLATCIFHARMQYDQDLCE